MSTDKTRRPLPANLGAAALESFRAMKRGDVAPRVHNPAQGANEVKALRERLDLTQAEFARRFGLSIDSLRQWEQGRREPDGAAKTCSRSLRRIPRRSPTSC